MEFVDGTATYDGVFYDVDSTVVEEVRNSFNLTACLHTSGNVRSCGNLGTRLICEKGLLPSTPRCVANNQLEPFIATVNKLEVSSLVI